MDEVFQGPPGKRRYSQLTLALMGKKIIQCSTCNRHMPSNKALAHHSKHCRNQEEGRPYQFTKVFPNCLLYPLGTTAQCNQFENEMALM